MNQVMKDTGCKNYKELKHKANERIEWMIAANQRFKLKMNYWVKY